MRAMSEVKYVRRFDLLDVSDREMSLLIMALRGLDIVDKDEVIALLGEIERARDSTK